MGMVAGQVLEAVMLVCLGAWWPIAAYRAYKAGTAAGYSWQLLLVVTLGYIAGAAAKLADGSVNWVFALYVLSLAVVAANWLVLARNTSRDRARVESAAEKPLVEGPLGHVVIASDGSKGSVDAAAFASEALGLRYAKSVMVLAVAPDDGEIAQKEANLAADQTLKILVDNGIHADKLVRTGQPAAVIVDTVAQENPDLCILGSRGVSGLEGAVLGSVSRQVIDRVGCPVLVTK